MEALSSPVQPPRMRLVSANRRPRRGFADMHVGLELETGTATHLIDDDGEAMATPQALRNVLADASVRKILAQHKLTIMAGMVVEDTTGEGSIDAASFRRIMQSLQIGFTAHQVEDLVNSLLFLAKIGRARGMPTPGGPTLVPYSLLFTEAVAPPTPMEATEEGDEGDEAAPALAVIVPSPQAATAPPASARGLAPVPPGMAALAAATHEADASGNEEEDDEEDELPLPNAIPFDAARRKLPFASEDAESDQQRDREGSGNSSGSTKLSDGRTVSDAVRSRAAASQRFRLPSINSDGPESERGGGSSGGTVTLKDGRTVSTAARSRAAASQRFRLPSVESLLDAAEKPITAASVRASVPELLASANVSVNLSAYSSIGVIAVFFASLSISVVVALLTGSQHLEAMPLLLTATFAAHALVIVLNVFTVLTMSMVYYYGQLHIGHGFEDTATHFVRNPLVKQLRHLALDAFWASAPLFMIAMALTFLAQYTGPDQQPSYGAVVVASIFGIGMLVTVWAVLAVLRAHREELHFHYHPEDRPKKEKETARAAAKKQRRRRRRKKRESWEDGASTRACTALRGDSIRIRLFRC